MLVSWIWKFWNLNLILFFLAASAASAGDAGAQGMLLNAAKHLAQALAELTDCCNDSEPGIVKMFVEFGLMSMWMCAGSKECEAAANAVMQAANQLGQRAQPTDFKQVRWIFFILFF